MRRFRKTVSVGAEVTSGGRLFQPPEMHDRRWWTVMYVGSLAARMTVTEDGGAWIGLDKVISSEAVSIQTRYCHYCLRLFSVDLKRVSERRPSTVPGTELQTADVKWWKPRQLWKWE